MLLGKHDRQRLTIDRRNYFLFINQVYRHRNRQMIAREAIDDFEVRRAQMG